MTAHELHIEVSPKKQGTKTLQGSPDTKARKHEEHGVSGRVSGSPHQFMKGPGNRKSSWDFVPDMKENY